MLALDVVSRHDIMLPPPPHTHTHIHTRTHAHAHTSHPFPSHNITSHHTHHSSTPITTLPRVPSRSDLAYVTVNVVDSTGTRNPNARERLKFEVTGVGELQAVGTGDPTDVSSFHTGTRVTYQGRAVAILRPAVGTPTGAITLKISAVDNSSIPPTTVTVQVA
jgi:hypothetical protein